MATKQNGRGRRRKGRFSLLYQIVSTLLICAAILVGCMVFFRVDQIVVAGDSRYEDGAIVEASGVKTGVNIFRINKYDIQRRVHNELPYVGEISISRKLPSTLIFTVRDSAPAAVVKSGAESWLLDVHCKLLEKATPAMTEQMPVVLGLELLDPEEGKPARVEEENQDKLNSLSQLLRALNERGMLAELTEFIDLTSENQVRFGMDQVLTVEMPLFGDFTEQTLRLQRALEELEKKNGRVTGTLHLPGEGVRAWLLGERWLPGQEEAVLPVPEATPAPAPETPDPALPEAPVPEMPDTEAADPIVTMPPVRDMETSPETPAEGG